MYGMRTIDESNRAVQYGVGGIGGAGGVGGVGGVGQPYVLSQLTGAYQALPSYLDNQHTIGTQGDADAYIARLAGFATLLEQESEVAQRDLARGVVPPDFALAKTLTQMRELRAPAPEKSPLTDSVVRRAKEKNIFGGYAQQASRVVQDQIYPALERQIAVVTEMQKKATHDAGVWRLPDGEAYYASSLVIWTTTGKKPEEIHQLGLELVKEHTASIDSLMRKIGMTQGTVGERLRAMYKDPKLQYPNTDAAKATLLADLNARVQRVRAKLPSYFRTVPKANVEIKRVPKEVEAGAPSGYYNNASLDGKRPGIYWINLRDTSEQPKWTGPTPTYPETVPGHHPQWSI